MKFSTGFIIGAVAGGYVVYNMTPQQRERVAQTADRTVQKVRSSSVVNSISSNVSGVAGAASDRVTDAVDSAGSAVADKVGPSDGDDSSSNGTTNGKSIDINA